MLFTYHYLGVPIEEVNDVVGDRAFSTDHEIVSVLGGVQEDILLSRKVLPIIKHIPGHGRAMVDSHLDLPVVETNLETLKKQILLHLKKILIIQWQ